MKCSMTYGTKHYGNNGNAPNYAITLTRTKRGAVSIVFDFDEPAAGKGVGDGQGEVHKVSLRLPGATAKALSHALQLALAETASTDVALRIEEQVEVPQFEPLV